MTTWPPSRPLLPVLGRMALGLGLVGAGLALAWHGAARTLTPGMSVQNTPLQVPLDGPLPLDLASSAALNFSGDRVNVAVSPLPPGSPMAVQGSARHRARNPVQAEVSRQGRAITAQVTLNVQPPNTRGVVLGGPEPVQHTLTLALARGLPLTLGSVTTSGDQRLQLTPLRVRALTLRSDSGDVALVLPARPAGPVSVVTRSGNVVLTAPKGSAPDALRVNTADGELRLNLAGMRTQTLGVGSDSGDLRLTLPVILGRATVTTATGDVTVSATPLTRGSLDIRTQGGRVTLRLPPALSTRVRFTDRDTLNWPRTRPPSPTPALDVFVDAPRSEFTLSPLEDTP
ncbi:DUF4097 family beta strand repeat-containing protein [Deinococcus aquaedulcis]|uniref:DUF4097 family beta strand repeat-containing protein n=1 Tax=Deinococcus aquaedulcis TaxID=2840455 RepID=UPI002E2845D2|nr:DUF4097 family beta strand repeat-containing protein [Deinococcus aquaedulcis]